ncbi:MAG: exodeoxyribonuclease VII small subunit [Methylophilus sp.]|nr:exodeoxyribonuclease VII small subunit [Methylophilus sp.]
MSASKKSSSVANDTQSFAQRVASLETIVRSMESGELPLEAALSAYAEGMQLLQACQGSLQQAEQTVLILNQQQQLTPFDPE